MFIRATRLRGLVIPVVFLASIPVAFVSPSIATYVWFTAIPINVLIGRSR